ncbi:Sodium-transporting two-sector ATPase [Nitrosococcus oceani ATCC 19707]|uniref:V-type ATP synthase alpha chain n=2 Tax=Nitrosococcus oceani TaxID=1229 RepID=VATA_NITOC|nr:V-type ATP synthase subunit A [Nitrosococcus oceani]Q3J9F3.1 RecName: Full=V-type ATP synthase alpha chain; AltName: Full=V-ATPase subunit A [Nitrosococcus oceani ATCC 19707]KFI19026.1 ATP synthase subunit A [Nitrosococcus oceani C-27]ABA58543.1 Sodium-transporting two-sector ATPase [Nitrosococcus oceani ATCC 19707]EDZ67182.1 ATP synthase alpha/beta family, nucleotide-binding domain protein [Nitrosococcus oceani AFC27]GEM19662.1 V-type ATP synthase alpha chain [Nitrosococcus oceani]
MGKLLEVNGPLVRARLPQVPNGEQVRIGTLGLVGEVIGREGQEALIQVYEGTESVRPGEEVEALGHPLSVELGPGLLGQVFDGIQRPLGRLLEASGDRISRGIQIQGLEQARVWRFQPNPQLAAGMAVTGGVCLGAVPETPTIEHRILVPPGLSGELLELAPEGEYRLSDVIARLDMGDHRSQALTLSHRWPVRNPRPYQQREHGVSPLMTGQRILDTFFPLLKGGKAAVPGPFGAGKTMVQQQIARWSNADIVIYVGCGERGNELVEVLDSFPELTDPHTGRSLMERTLLVANTSNMPVVAREASLYVGVTLGEYYRDQGYDVVIVADSTSRWAEALREVAGRLGQMPVEEGYPAYLASRLAAFYERAGRVQTLGGSVGSVTLIGAVSPPGGDFSEPVTSHTKEIVRTFWALSKDLADARHYPAVSWRESFSDDIPVAARWWAEHIDKHWQAGRAEAMTLLTQAEELSRIVNLVGPEALSGTQRWILEGATLIKEGLLQQSALDPVDSFCAPEKQFVLLDLMLQIYHQGVELLEQGVPVQELLGLPVLARARRCKSDYKNTQVETLQDFTKEIKEAFGRLGREHAEAGKI